MTTIADLYGCGEEVGLLASDIEDLSVQVSNVADLVVNQPSSEFIDGPFSGLVLAGISASIPITLVPSAGKRLRLDRLTSTTGTQAITITVGARVVVNNKVLQKRSTSNNGDFAVTGGESGDGHGILDLSRWSGCRGPIVGGVDESIVMTANDSFSVRYSFTESA